MTVSSTTARKTFAGNGVTTSFATSPMVFFDSTDLTVYVVTTATGAVVATLALTTDYTVTGGAGTTGTVATTGLYGAPATGQTLVIVRSLPRTQETDFENNDPNDADVAEETIDRLTMIAQEFDTKFARTAKLSDTDVSGAVVTLPTPSASKVLKWTSNGLALENSTYDPDTQVAAAAASASAAATSASAAATSATASSTSATLASDWATKTSAIVAATDYSAKEFAIGSQAATGGSSKNWAQQTGADVTGAAANSRSAKSWAQDNNTGATLGGSAKDWAQSASLPDGTLKSSKSYAADSATSATASASSATAAAASAASVACPRGFIDGCIMSTAGSSATMTIGAGMAADSTNAVLMNKTTSVGKTTSAWAVGTGNGGLDTGSIANNTWYHFYQIRRSDTGVVDYLFSTSASAPTMPTSYDAKRRIGSGKTNGSAQWILFVQVGDEFLWDTSILDVNTSGDLTAATSVTLTVPTGVKVHALFSVNYLSSAINNSFGVSSLDESSQSAGGGTTRITNMGQGVGSPWSPMVLSLRTNTSAQVRRRSDDAAATALAMRTYGWIDERGRDV